MARENGFKVGVKGINKLLKYYDKDLDDRLSFKEFLPLVLPLSSAEMREAVVGRENYSLGRGAALPYTVEYTLAQLVHKEVLLHSNVERQALKLFNCYDYNVQAAFKIVDARHTRYVTGEMLSKFLKKMKTEARAEDVNAFIRRLDKDLDCKVSFHEFAELFHPSSAAKAKPSYITPTKSFQAGVSRSGSSVGKKSLQKRKSSAIKYSNTPAKANTVNKKINTAKKSTNSTLLYPYQRELGRSHSLIGTRPKSKSSGYALRRAKTPIKPQEKTGANSASHSKSAARASVKQARTVFNILKQQIRAEEQIELLKQNLILCKDLTLPKVWAIFDPKSKGYIQVLELAKSLKSLGITEDEEAAYLLFNRFDLNMDGLWTLADIENLIIPAERDYEEIIAAKIERDATKKLRNETLDLLKRLLTTYIRSELDNEKLKQSLSDVNERGAFNEFSAADADWFAVAEV